MSLIVYVWSQYNIAIIPCTWHSTRNKGENRARCAQANVITVPTQSAQANVITTVMHSVAHPVHRAHTSFVMHTIGVVILGHTRKQSFDCFYVVIWILAFPGLFHYFHIVVFDVLHEAGIDIEASTIWRLSIPVSFSSTATRELCDMWVWDQPLNNNACIMHVPYTPEK